MRTSFLMTVVKDFRNGGDRNPYTKLNYISIFPVSRSVMGVVSGNLIVWMVGAVMHYMNMQFTFFPFCVKIFTL